MKNLATAFWEYTKDIRNNRTDLGETSLTIKGHYQAAIRGDIEAQAQFYEELEKYWVSVENYEMAGEVTKKHKTLDNDHNFDI